MKEYPETCQQGIISIENIPDEMYLKYIRGNYYNPIFMSGDLSIQIAEDGRVWININGIAFLRFKPIIKEIGKK